MNPTACNGLNSGICKNSHLNHMETDILYHLGLRTDSVDFVQAFGDVKFICMGGSPTRMFRFAEALQRDLEIPAPSGQGPVNVTGSTDRYTMYKVGQVLCVSHGMGIPSISILLHELAKLLHHANCRNVTMIRLGTSGGLGIKPGTVVVTNECVDGLFRPFLEMHVLGQSVLRPTKLDVPMAEELFAIGHSFKEFNVVFGKTMCANGFYEEQGRLDGAICTFTLEDKMRFLERARSEGVCNIEMESSCFAAFCHHLQIRGAVITVVLTDRLHSDQCTQKTQDSREWEMRPFRIASAYIKSRLTEMSNRIELHPNGTANGCA